MCNGFKRDQYIANIVSLIDGGHTNCIPIIDNYEELDLIFDYDPEKKWNNAIKKTGIDFTKFSSLTGNA